MLFSIFTFFKTIKYLKYPRKQIVFTRIKKLTWLMANCAGTDLVFLSKSRITYLSLSVYLVFILHVSLIYRSKLKMGAPNQIFSRFFFNYYIYIYILNPGMRELQMDWELLLPLQEVFKSQAISQRSFLESAKNPNSISGPITRI